MKKLAPDGGEWGNENCLRPLSMLLKAKITIYQKQSPCPQVFGEECEKECHLYLDNQEDHYYLFIDKCSFTALEVTQSYEGYIENSADEDFMEPFSTVTRAKKKSKTSTEKAFINKLEHYFEKIGTSSSSPIGASLFAALANQFSDDDDDDDDALIMVRSNDFIVFR